MKLIPITDRAAWLAERRRNVGGSEVAALFDRQPEYALSAWALWQIKAGRLDEPEVDTERAEWGLRLETAIAEAAAEKEDWTIAKAGYAAHPSVRGMAATLDYLIATGEQGRADQGVLEIKNTDWLQERRAWGGEPPPHILLQLQQQLACTGLKWGAVAALVGGNHLEVYRYEARPKIIRELERRITAFWKSIRDDRPPPVDGSRSTARVVAALFPGNGGAEPLDLTDDSDLPDLCIDKISYGAAASEAEEHERQADSAIKVKLGGAPAAVTAGYRVQATDVAENPGTVITAAMVGEVINARKGYRRITVRAIDREGQP